MDESKAVTKVSDVKELVRKGVKDPKEALTHIRNWLKARTGK